MPQHSPYGGWPAGGEIGAYHYLAKDSGDNHGELVVVFCAKISNDHWKMKSLQFGMFPDIVEASGMRNYHCGGTDRSIETVQVSKFYTTITITRSKIFWPEQSTLWAQQGSTLE